MIQIIKTIKTTRKKYYQTFASNWQRFLVVLCFFALDISVILA
jgi:hypothetical protein